jgi:hypothetical protein
MQTSRRVRPKRSRRKRRPSHYGQCLVVPAGNHLSLSRWRPRTDSFCRSRSPFGLRSFSFATCSTSKRLNQWRRRCAKGRPLSGVQAIGRRPLSVCSDRPADLLHACRPNAGGSRVAGIAAASFVPMTCFKQRRARSSLSPVLHEPLPRPLWPKSEAVARSRGASRADVRPRRCCS